MSKLFAVAAGVVAALSVQIAPAFAQQAENMRLIANYDDGGTYRLMPDDARLAPAAPEGAPQRVVIDWNPEDGDQWASVCASVPTSRRWPARWEV